MPRRKAVKLLTVAVPDDLALVWCAARATHARAKARYDEARQRRDRRLASMRGLWYRATADALSQARRAISRCVTEQVFGEGCGGWLGS